MAKAAEEALAMTLAREERGHGIHVNVVAPGLVATDMGDRLVRATAGVARRRGPHVPVAVRARVHLGGVAAAVRFLVSADAGYITGQRIGVDGGDFWRARRVRTAAKRSTPVAAPP